MKNDKLKSGEVIESILETIADELIDMGGYYKPRLNVIIGHLIKEIIKRRKINKKKIQRAIKILEKKEIIALEEKDEQIFVQLHNKGKSTVLKYSIKSLFDFKKLKKKWQKKWYLVFFDVPEIQRNKRDYLRRFLLKLGFYPYQKSVYLFPYECEKEINLIKKIVEGAKYMKYIIAEKIEDENLAKIFFKLT
ncbi:CRISPR-associated endonuclease Cas2 [Candidatus Roizmanbacteria bacterium CG_4_10_14_0_2_um_filter_36_35]|uniref:CRISPR-associated endonuclease Cas2 n=4 Tax=Candidatus Roizmaniibacteriota TaxID=1752723 RepID=A0A2M7BWP6_9BACT|nr:MAG: CRISPR-associated endonuclease Cas2 [Candidatus Roizmanbacteria bacterium CG11_big_fil_rev_8_21_14_0_20_35_14]PIV10996.1 MAG: CRISPR-associated endonuclease Cas2 [Candidatus Roizmanbacteria bacterium CG03_land_8_20_14_0_80_35_26]PIZ67685.1 MAG: CRISPR-associated endonuclease Cas2 [Candidatus Roizmanbacteria bacterium CG_4_10_14_0_2_um_filter_36_35]PJC33110.1 MAG: CRISPR-associated endonuclease Cas2 [Candidatus Roizmanbacteria bacterium CG_4_9_14_0_2_um_filter_36_12]PJC80003.1 MAG: CRISP